MDETVQTNLDAYVERYKRIHERLQNAEAATAIVQELAKDARTSGIRSARQRPVGAGTYVANGDEEPATQKQIDWLKDLGIDLKPGLTKREASAILDQAVGKRVPVIPRRVP